MKEIINFHSFNSPNK